VAVTAGDLFQNTRYDPSPKFALQISTLPQGEG
jgi:hypothetical protein